MRSTQNPKFLIMIIIAETTVNRFRALPNESEIITLDPRAANFLGELTFQRNGCYITGHSWSSNIILAVQIFVIHRTNTQYHPFLYTL